MTSSAGYAKDKADDGKVNYGQEAKDLGAAAKGFSGGGAPPPK